MRYSFFEGAVDAEMQIARFAYGVAEAVLQNQSLVADGVLRLRYTPLRMTAVRDIKWAG